jgi:UTP--glucose-1-phosphate uridylyltransferase
MQIRKAVITAAGRDQRNLPMQTLFDEQGTERSVLNLVVREAVRAGVGDICIVVWPGDEEPYARRAADLCGANRGTRLRTRRLLCAGFCEG